MKEGKEAESELVAAAPTPDKVNVLKDSANDLFKSGDYEKSLEAYLMALSQLSLASSDSSLQNTIHKNLAANYLKLNQYEEALLHCDKALEISPQDPKTLFRRATSLEHLERFEEAYRDAQKALISSPGDAAIFKPLLSRLHLIVEERRTKFSQTKEKAIRMMKLAFEPAANASEEDIETGLNNVLVLCRERAGIEALLELGLLEKLRKLINLKQPTVKDMNHKITAVRTFTEIIQYSTEMCKRILSEAGIPFIISLQDLADPVRNNKKLVEEAMVAVQYLWQTILYSLSGAKKDEKKPNPDFLEANKPEIESLLTTLAVSINSRSILGETRDTVLQIFIKNIDYKSVGWGERFLDVGGLGRLLDVVSEVPEFHIESGMELSQNTRNLASALFTILYDNMYYDAVRKKYTDIVDDYIKDLLAGPEIESKVRVTSILTALLMGPVDVGNSFIGRPGILQMILVMAGTDDFVQQKVASEAIVAAASKKDKAKGIITDGTAILKKLYQSKNDEVKVRALVGLCKLGSTGGTDASWKPFAEGAMLKLTEACRRFLLSPSKDITIRRWAVEGLSYLTLDAEVKEQLVQDKAAVAALLELSKHAKDMGDVLYPIITCLVNLVNSYDKQEIIPEMLELAKFAKHHIPEEHEFDDPDFVEKRIEVLVEVGVASCLVNLAKATESANILELIARILNAICERQEHRGAVVAQGGARELLTVWKKASPKGKILAAQALARIGITQAPSVAFPGQRSSEVVKPLLSILHVECTALQNFESLLALCNLAGESDTLRKNILEDQGLSKIEHYMYEEHPMLKRASLQCMINLSLNEKVLKAFEGDNDRVKYMMLICLPVDGLGDEDKEEILTITAAASILAILSSSSRIICGKILSCTKNAMEVLLWIVANPLVEIQLRGVTIVANIVAADKEFAEQLVGTTVFEVLLALSIPETAETSGESSKLSPEDRKKKEDVKRIAGEALKAAEKWGLIKKN